MGTWVGGSGFVLDRHGTCEPPGSLSVSGGSEPPGHLSVSGGSEWTWAASTGEEIPQGDVTKRMARA